MINRLRRFLPQSHFGRNVAVLMSGTIFAQAIPILISPILTRLYSPDSFGSFALFISIATLLSMVATGKYDFAVMVAKEDPDARTLVVLVVLLSVVFSVGLWLVGLYWGQDLFSLLNTTVPYDPLWVGLLPMTVMILAMYQASYVYINRCGAYKCISLSQGGQAIVTSAANIGLGWTRDSYYYLIVSKLLGLLSSIVILQSAFGSVRAFIAPVSWPSLWGLARRYVNFPKLSLPADMLSQVAADLPIYMLIALYGDASAGLYALSLRVVGVPLTIIGSAVQNVFRQEAAAYYSQHGECQRIYIRTFKVLAGLSLFPFLALGLLAVPLFGFIFGEQWVAAGEMTQIMIIMYYFKFIAGPLSYMYFIAEQQKEDLYLHVYIVLSSFILIYLGHVYYHNVIYSLAFYALNYTGIYLYVLVRCYQFSKGNGKK